MSFKLKLVAYFLLVALLPLGAAALGSARVAKSSETRKVDARLEAGFARRSPPTRHSSAAADRAREALAANRDLQGALLRRTARNARGS